VQDLKSLIIIMITEYKNQILQDVPIFEV